MSAIPRARRRLPPVWCSTRQVPLKSDYRRFQSQPGVGGRRLRGHGGSIAAALYAREERVRCQCPTCCSSTAARGSLAEAMKVLEELELDWLRVVAVAKGRARKPGAEQLFVPGDKQAMTLRADSSALLLIQQIRDEAHRFAITGHRQRRAKARKTSQSGGAYAGLGPKRRRELLRQFGGLQGVMAAGVDDLIKVRGISRALAESIYNDLHLDG